MTTVRFGSALRVTTWVPPSATVVTDRHREVGGYAGVVPPEWVRVAVSWVSSSWPALTVTVCAGPSCVVKVSVVVQSGRCPNARNGDGPLHRVARRRLSGKIRLAEHDRTVVLRYAVHVRDGGGGVAPAGDVWVRVATGSVTASSSSAAVRSRSASQSPVVKVSGGAQCQVGAAGRMTPTVTSPVGREPRTTVYELDPPSGTLRVCVDELTPTCTGGC